MNTSIKFEKALNWLKQNTVNGAGVSVSNKNKRPYPEVTGYFIPTLIRWGEFDLAKTYIEWLLKVQHQDGSWGDADNDQSYAFDTGQIIKGLMAYSLKFPNKNIDAAINKACDWMCACVAEDGSPAVPDIKGWGKSNVPPGILLYAYQAVIEAGKYYENDNWINKSNRLVSWFLSDVNLTNFTCLSHFHAYIIEALIDLGYYEKAEYGMKIISKQMNFLGKIPAYKNSTWTCSTGAFQYALIWYKLGNYELGDKAFKYILRKQNKSGGWYGGYGLFARYFRRAEISWAVKYFFDALHFRLKLNFERQSNSFMDRIDRNDDRYKLVYEEIRKKNGIRVLDVGAGKGRFIKNLKEDLPNNEYHASDLSFNVLQNLPENIYKSIGSILDIHYSDEYFDLVYCSEVLEHAVNINAAMKELYRVTKKYGVIIIIDKNKKTNIKFKTPDWEQWFIKDELATKMELVGLSVQTKECNRYEGKNNDLFLAWIGTK